MPIGGKTGVPNGSQTDCFTKTERSWVMSRIRSYGNRTTELRFIRFARRFGVIGWRRGSRLFGKPDFVFSRAKLVVFVDGDFWPCFQGT